MTLNLKLLNLFIAMCKGTPTVPRELYILGYREHAIEFSFQNSQSEAVVPELIIASGKTGNSILFEWKSGANTHDEQLARYAAVTTEDLVQRAYLAPEQAKSHDIVIVGLIEHRERLKIGIVAKNYPFPLLLINETGLEIALNRFNSKETDEFFRGHINIDWQLLPAGYVVVDQDSTEAEFAEHIFPIIFTEMSKGKVRVTCKEICEEMLPLYIYANAQYKYVISRKVANVMNYAVNHQFRSFMKPSGLKARTGTPTWDITQNPFTNPPGPRSKVWREMNKLQAALMQALDSNQGELQLETFSPS